MDEIVLKNARKIFHAARRNNENFSDEIYDICDYLAIVIPETVTPKQLGNHLIILKYDLIGGIDHTVLGEFAKEEFDKLVKNKEQVIAQIQYIPQIVDQIANKKFVRKFREYCKAEFNIDPPVKLRFKNSDDYPDYVEASANWWVAAIQSPKLDIGEPDFSEYLALLSKNGSMKLSRITKKDLDAFHKELEAIIFDDVLRYGECKLYVDYEPLFRLAEAAKVISKESLVTFPFKTCMHIYEGRVYVQTCSGRKKIFG